MGVVSSAIFSTRVNGYPDSFNIYPWTQSCIIRIITTITVNLNHVMKYTDGLCVNDLTCIET